jgi:DNA-binding transcriptional MerR regulator
LSTLHQWVKDRLVVPTYRAPSGRRATCWWSFRDVVAVRAIKSLRDAGCPMQSIKKVKAMLANEPESFGTRVLWWSGSDIEIVDAMGTVTSALRAPGQLVFHFVTIPLGALEADVIANSEGHIDRIDPVRLRRLSRIRQATP